MVRGVTAATADSGLGGDGITLSISEGSESWPEAATSDAVGARIAGQFLAQGAQDALLQAPSSKASNLDEQVTVSFQTGRRRSGHR